VNAVTELPVWGGEGNSINPKRGNRCMVKDDQDNVPGLLPWRRGEADLRFGTSGRLLRVAVVGLCLASLGLTGCTGGAATGTAPPAKASSRLFFGWPTDRKPDVVLVLSGQQHGYLEPCGCSSPQYGGLPRRYNFLQGLIKERGWPVVAVDVGDIAQRAGPQALLKYKYSMEALKRLNYTAVGVGENEMRMPLLDALAAFALNNESPRTLAANLLNKEQNFPNMVYSSAVGGGKDGVPAVGVVGVVGPSVTKSVRDADVRFDANDKVIPGALKELEGKKPDLLVLLYQGSVDEAKACAKKYPQFQVILCLTQEEEPSGDPVKEGQTLIIGVGHKGRYVGAVGAYKTGKDERPWDLRYQLVQIGLEYETPEGKEADNPILAKLEEYTQEVKRDNYLAKFPRTNHPVQLAFKNATYVGSDKCKKCHEEAYKVWIDSPHAHAYKTLVEKAKPSLRQYDGECVVCHVTGFGYQGGFTDEKQTPHLMNNGCENCHGPGSAHIKDNYNEELRALMNPYKTKPNETPEAKAQRINRLDQSCQKCHDIDNDVHFTFAEKWSKIVHPMPKRNRPPEPPAGK
jgi:hypothetical protein